MLNSLEKKGYAERKPDPQDKRRVLVHITDAGRKMTAKRYEEGVEMGEASLCVLGEEDTIALQRIFRKLVEHEGTIKW